MSKNQEYNGHTYRVERSWGNRYRIYIDGRCINSGKTTETTETIIALAKRFIDILPKQ